MDRGEGDLPNGCYHTNRFSIKNLLKVKTVVTVIVVHYIQIQIDFDKI